MNIEQINKELNEINNDNNITLEEKKMYLAVFGAELERQKYDEYINNQKQAIQKLRVKIIDDIMNLYPSLGEQQKEFADRMLYELGFLASTSPSNSFGDIDDIINKYELDNRTLTGTIPVYLDENIHKEIEIIKDMEKNFHKLIERKYVTLEDKLSDIIDPEVFNFVKKDNPDEYKEQSEFDSIFVKENDTISRLEDIGAREKGILKNILAETIKYGKSYGTMYEDFPDLTEYIDETKSKIVQDGNGKTM